MSKPGFTPIDVPDELVPVVKQLIQEPQLWESFKRWRFVRGRLDKRFLELSQADRPAPGPEEIQQWLQDALRPASESE